MSNSFPYMALAKKHGVDYGEMLRFAQYHLTVTKEASLAVYLEVIKEHSLQSLMPIASKFRCDPALMSSFTLAIRQTREARYGGHS